MSKRLFTAVSLPENYVQAFKKIAQENAIKGVRWTSLNNLHLTIHFLGDIKEKNVPVLKNKLGTIKHLNAFKLTFDKLSFAPPGRPPRMIWTQFCPSEQFDKLVETIYEAAKDFSHNKPRHRQIPHITLARFKEWANFRTIKVPEIRLNDLEIKEVKLISSTLTPQGPFYKNLECFSLKT